MRFFKESWSFSLRGLITQLIREDFFSVTWLQYLESWQLSCVFGTASLMKILAPTLYDEETKKLLPGKKLNKRTVFSGKISGKALALTGFMVK